MIYRDEVKLQDTGTQLLVDEVLDGIESYLEAKLTGSDGFEYRGSTQNVDDGIEIGLRDYDTLMGELSHSADRDKTMKLRLRWLELYERVKNLEGNVE